MEIIPDNSVFSKISKLNAETPEEKLIKQEQKQKREEQAKKAKQIEKLNIKKTTEFKMLQREIADMSTPLLIEKAMNRIEIIDEFSIFEHEEVLKRLKQRGVITIGVISVNLLLAALVAGGALAYNKLINKNKLKSKYKRFNSDNKMINIG
jgi:hypothetical protein